MEHGRAHLESASPAGKDHIPRIAQGEEDGRLREEPLDQGQLQAVQGIAVEEDLSLRVESRFADPLPVGVSEGRQVLGSGVCQGREIGGVAQVAPDPVGQGLLLLEGDHFRRTG